MTTIDPQHNDIIATPEQARAAMTFNPAAPKMGVEMEFHILDMRGGGDIADDARVRVLKDALRTRHHLTVDDEIGGHMLEIKTSARDIAGLPRLLAEIARAQNALVAEAAALDLKPASLAAIPGLTAERALQNLIAPTNENPERGARARTMMAALRDMNEDAQIAYPLLNASAQVSIGAQSPQHLHAMMRRHYIMAPFMMTLFHNRADMGGPHSGIAARAALGNRGLLPSSFGISETAEQFILNHQRTVFARPMFCAIDARGDFRKAAQLGGGTQDVTLQSLAQDGLATRSNVLLSQSMDWHLAKMKTIPHSTAMRAELRDMDISGFAAREVAVIYGLINMVPECGAAVDRLLAGFGYPNAPRAIFCHLHSNLREAMNDAAKGADVRFGAARVREFARDLYSTLLPHARRHGVADALIALPAAADGVTAGAVLARALPDLQSAQDFVRKAGPEFLTETKSNPVLALA